MPTCEQTNPDNQKRPICASNSDKESNKYTRQVFAKAAVLLAERQVEIAEIMARDLYKTSSDSAAEIARSIETLRWHSLLDNSFLVEKIGNGEVFRHWRPAGPVVAIVPWNFPLLLAVRKVASALYAGCAVTVMADPRSQPVIRLFLDVLRDAGLSEKSVDLCTDAPKVGLAKRLQERDVRSLTFTGSTAVGRTIAAQIAPYLIRPVLELGGHAPVIVHTDVDLKAFVEKLVPFKLHYAGQSCAAPSRLILRETQREEVLAALKSRLSNARPGPASDSGASFGPIFDHSRLRSLHKLVKDAQEKGAEIWRPTWASDVEHDLIMAPVLIIDPDKGADILNIEPFGPILSVQFCGSIEEQIEQANANNYGLNAYIFANDSIILKRLAASVKAGTVTCNRFAGVDCSIGQAGTDQSGYGFEGGTEGVLSFCNPMIIRD